MKAVLFCFAFAYCCGTLFLLADEREEENRTKPLYFRQKTQTGASINDLRQQILETSFSSRTNIAHKFIEEYPVTNLLTQIDIVNTLTDKTLFGNLLVDDARWRKFLLDIYQTNKHPALLCKATFGLITIDQGTALEKTVIEKLVAEGRWDAIQFAIRWNSQSLLKFVELRLETENKSYWESQPLIYVMPYYFIKKDIPVLPLKKQSIYWLKMQCDLHPEKVYARDLAMAYLAKCKNEKAISFLNDKYQKATDPKCNRKPSEKDKRYWFVLLCLTGQAPDVFPDVPFNVD